MIDSGEEVWYFAKNLQSGECGYIPSNYVVIDDNKPESQELVAGGVTRGRVCASNDSPFDQVVLRHRTKGSRETATETGHQKGNFPNSTFDRNEQMLLSHSALPMIITLTSLFTYL